MDRPDVDDAREDRASTASGHGASPRGSRRARRAGRGGSPRRGPGAPPWAARWQAHDGSAQGGSCPPGDGWSPPWTHGDGDHWRGWADRRRRPPVLLVPFLVAVATAVWTASAWGGDKLVGDRDPDVLAYGLLLLAAAALVVRRRIPGATVAVTTGVAILYPLLDYPTTGAFLLPMVVALYAATARGQRRWAMAAAVVYLASFVWLAVLPGEVQPEAVLIVPVWVLGAIVAGEGARNRRAFVAEAYRRAQESQRSRAEEDRRRESEERVRIAREVHDVVSHSIAMINVQAGVAAHLLDDDPEQARTALVAIKEASRDALRDLRATLGVLRAVDDAAAGGDGRAPTPGLARLDELAERLESAGLEVEVTTTGIDGLLPAGVDLAAYRIVQEAVSNVLRHADAATVRIEVRREGGLLRIAVTDDGSGADPTVDAPVGTATPERSLARLGRRPPPAPDRPGHAAPATVTATGNGLRGMRERATALGGRVEAGPAPGGGWRVRAELPVRGPAGTAIGTGAGS